ncbi:MAG: hypothetical protein ACREPI_12600 [Candidatus Dormibacterales bacterium]
MRHLPDGILRRLADDPDSVLDAQRAHARTCERCGAALAGMREDMRAASGLLEGPAPTPRTDSALAAMRSRIRAERSPGGWERFRGRFESVRIRPAAKPVVAVAAVLLVSGTAAAAAVGPLRPLFEPTHVVTFDVSASELHALPDLRAYGTEKLGAMSAPRQVGSVAAAEAASGLTLTLPAKLPSGVSGVPAYFVAGQERGSFTFSAQLAAAHAATLGAQLPPMPNGMDGSTLYATAGPAIVATYGGGGLGSAPTFAVAVARPPAISTNGSLTVTQIEDYLLSQPGVPSALASQLKSLGDPTAALPIPIPTAYMSSQPVTVDGASGVLITENSGLGSAVVWESGGVVHAVGGMLDQQAVIDAARGLG